MKIEYLKCFREFSIILNIKDAQDIELYQARLFLFNIDWYFSWADLWWNYGLWSGFRAWRFEQNSIGGKMEGEVGIREGEKNVSVLQKEGFGDNLVLL